jgi:putative transposase
LREVGMSRKRFTMEQIIGLLREVDVKVSQGRIVEQICREIGITEQTYYRWRKEYGGMKTVQVKRLKELEKENTHLKKAVAELTVDKLILKEALEGNY